MKNSTLRLVNFAILSVLWLLLAAAAHGQSPSTSEPNPQALYGVNSKWTNGIAPGYYPTCSPGSCVGLTLNVGPGTCFDSSGTRHAYAGANLTMTNAATNYVYLDAACTVSQNTSGYIIGDIPVATVVTSGGNITTVTDDRTFFALRAIGYAIVESNGASVTSRGTLNLVNGTGASVSCVDNSGASRTDCTFSTTAVTGPTYGSQYCQAFTTGTVSSLACSTGTLTVTTGDVMFAACGTFTNDGGTKTISIADTQSTAWTQAVTYYSTSTGERLSIWWGVAGSTGADTFTCSLSAGSNGFWSLVVQQIVGANSSSPVDATGTGSQGTGSSMISNSLTTSSSNDLALVWAGTNNNDAGAVTLGGFAAFAPSALGNYLGVKTLQGSGTYTIQVVNVGTPWSNISVAIH